MLLDSLTPHQCFGHISRTVHCLSCVYFVSKLVGLKLVGFTHINEPKKFHQTVKDDRWKKVMQKEVTVLEQNSTCELTLLPPGKKAIDSKWVYKITE
uniref:Reverse transcriptase Ty1/copia-type domain-containing protein n=1 Tax=Lactuca sativa TaxID=4236 RepID=A0A9R1XFP4_LACSA|nr:hypothetical protein LSAT_V11C400204190 [Lactuca sativa]